METKNEIICNYASSLVGGAVCVNDTAKSLSDNEETNIAFIKTLNVLLESVRAQTVLLQQALDNYK